MIAKQTDSYAKMIIMLYRETIQEISRRRLGRDLSDEEMEHLESEMEKRFNCKKLAYRAMDEHLFGPEHYLKTLARK